MIGKMAVSALALALAGCSSGSEQGAQPPADETPTATLQLLSLQTYRQMCDASAAVMLDASTFVVANDEDNFLRVYRVGTPDPLNEGEDDLSEFLGTEGDEADIEGAARIGSRVYWITSHGASRRGKERLERRRFFATEITVSSDQAIIEPIGEPYVGLFDDLAGVPALKALDLPGMAKNEVAPEAGSLNIEGLAAGPDGTLLVALRSPLTGNGAGIVIPLLNPAEVVMGGQPQLGSPHFLDLGTRGVRSIDAAGDGESFFVVAGAVGDGPFEVFRWRPGASVDSERLKKLTVDLQGLSPEAISRFGGASGGRWLVLSDDGDVPVGGIACKDSDDKRFRAGELALGQVP